MPAPVTGDAFLDLVRKTGLVNADVLAACLSKIGGEIPLPTEPKPLAELLVREGWLLHRDIEPGNILVDRKGRVKIVDFGLARAVEGTDHDFVKHYVEQLLVAAEYLAPEFELGSRVAQTADIYSLGATFYFCLSGQPPCGEATFAKKIPSRHRRPAPLRSLRPEIAEEMATIIDRMLARNPAERFASAQAVFEALAPWRQRPVAVPTDDEMPHHCPAVRRLLQCGCM